MLISKTQWRKIQKTLGLSFRELEIARLVFDMLNVEEMAKRLHIAPSTIGSHLGNLYRRTGARDKTELVIIILKIAKS